MKKGHSDKEDDFFHEIISKSKLQQWKNTFKCDRCGLYSNENRFYRDTGVVMCTDCHRMEFKKKVEKTLRIYYEYFLFKLLIGVCPKIENVDGFFAGK